MSNKHAEFLTTNLLTFFSKLPLWLARWIAQILAWLINTFGLTQTAKVIQLNLQIALPELNAAQRNLLTKKAIHNELTSYLEFFHIWGASTQQNIEKIHRIYNQHLFHEALAAKQGLVLVVPHFGTWEIMNAWVAQFSDMTIMYKPIKNKATNQFVRHARAREQSDLVPTNETGVRQIFKALKQGKTTVILPDHSPNFEAEMISYFNIPLFSSNLSAKLIQKTKAKALFLYAVRNSNLGFDMFIEPIDEKIYNVTANQGTEIIFQQLEDLIRKSPENYHWSYKRFSAHPNLHKIYDMHAEEALAKINQLRS